MNSEAITGMAMLTNVYRGFEALSYAFVNYEISNCLTSNFRHHFSFSPVYEPFISSSYRMNNNLLIDITSESTSILCCNGKIVKFICRSLFR